VSRAPDLVEQLFNAAFDKPRDPRSAEYKEGVRATLMYRLTGDRVRCPYAPQLAQSDAWYAGTEEGHLIWRAHQEAVAKRIAAMSAELSEVC